LLEQRAVRVGRGIRHRVLTLAVVGMVTAALSADALYRSISVTHAQRIERAREAVHEELDRLASLGPSANDATSAVVGLRGGIAPRAGAAAAIAAAIPPKWVPALQALAGGNLPAEAMVDLDGGQLIAAIMLQQTGTLGGFLGPPATTPLGKAQLRQRADAAGEASPTHRVGARGRAPSVRFSRSIPQLIRGFPAGIRLTAAKALS
jgi:hypothetical protein